VRWQPHVYYAFAGHAACIWRSCPSNRCGCAHVKASQTTIERPERVLIATEVLAARAPVTSGFAQVDLDAQNLPSEQEYVAAYCARTGRDGIPGLDFYLAFNLFRFAAIIHGIKGRAARGTAASPHAAALIADLPKIAELGWQQARSLG
jgi:hypothetical protein